MASLRILADVLHYPMFASSSSVSSSSRSDSSSSLHGNMTTPYPPKYHNPRAGILARPPPRPALKQSHTYPIPGQKQSKRVSSSTCILGDSVPSLVLMSRSYHNPQSRTACFFSESQSRRAPKHAPLTRLESLLLRTDLVRRPFSSISFHCPRPQYSQLCPIAHACPTRY